MPVRIHYVRTELSEGEVEVLPQVDAYEIMSDGTIQLLEYMDEGTVETEGGRLARAIGYVHPDRWQSIITLDEVNR